MLFKPKRGTKKGIISVYNKRGFIKSIECKTLVIILDEQVYKIGNYGNQKKLCGISTCHAFLSGDILFQDVALVGKHDLIKYDVFNAKFTCESGKELSQGDAVIINAVTKKCYVVRGGSNG